MARNFLRPITSTFSYFDDVPKRLLSLLPKIITINILKNFEKSIFVYIFAVEQKILS